jgi:hypothetical protein
MESSRLWEILDDEKGWRADFIFLAINWCQMKSTLLIGYLPQALMFYYALFEVARLKQAENL